MAKKKVKKKGPSKNATIVLALDLEQIATLLTGGRVIILDERNVVITTPGTSPEDWEDTLDSLRSDIEMDLMFSKGEEE